MNTIIIENMMLKKRDFFIPSVVIFITPCFFFTKKRLFIEKGDKCKGNGDCYVTIRRHQHLKATLFLEEYFLRNKRQVSWLTHQHYS
jgi:hypothetical protein